MSLQTSWLGILKSWMFGKALKTNSPASGPGSRSASCERVRMGVQILKTHLNSWCVWQLPVISALETETKSSEQEDRKDWPDQWALGVIERPCFKEAAVATRMRTWVLTSLRSGTDKTNLWLSICCSVYFIKNLKFKKKRICGSRFWS